MEDRESFRRIRFWLGVFIVGVALSGTTAFPLATETRWLDAAVHASLVEPLARATGLLAWVVRVHQGVADTNARYPFMAYGTDWLAFGHLAIATAFLGAWRDPLRNRWLITFGLIACGGVIPLAMIAGAVRGIPLGWRMIDCSFGVFGSIPLLICRRSLAALEREARSKPIVHSA
jgi:hypothetical protein